MSFIASSGTSDRDPVPPPQPPPQPPPAPRRSATEFVPDLAAAAALIVALIVLHHQVLRLWWNHDDVFVLHYVSEHRPWQYCLEPQVWRQLPMRMLTPLLFLSMHLDLGLFGADPRAQYAHQLAAAALAFLGFYAVLRLWLPPAPAALGTGVALAGAPAASLRQLPPTRHYLEGMVLAALAIVLFVRAAAAGREPPAGRRALALSLSALCYLAASLAKEVFVPLVLFFPWLAPGGVGRRLRLTAPHFGAFLFYLGWRLYMLGTLGGGYGWSVWAADPPRLPPAPPPHLVAAIDRPSPPGRAGPSPLRPPNAPVSRTARSSACRQASACVIPPGRRPPCTSCSGSARPTWASRPEAAGSSTISSSAPCRPRRTCASTTR